MFYWFLSRSRYVWLARFIQLESPRIKKLLDPLAHYSNEKEYIHIDKRAEMYEGVGTCIVPEYKSKQ